MAKVESLGNLVSVITKNSKFMIFDNNNVLTNAGLNNPNKINITENGTYYLVNNLDSNYSNSDIDIELVINEEYAPISTIGEFSKGSSISILRNLLAISYNFSFINIQEPFLALPGVLYSIL